MAKKVRARQVRRELREKDKVRENRTLELVVAILLVVATFVGFYFAISTASYFGIIFCIMWLGGSVFWLMSILGYRS